MDALLDSIGIEHEFVLAAPTTGYQSHYLRVGPKMAGYHSKAVQQYTAKQYNPPRLTESTLYLVQQEIRDAICRTCTLEDESSDGTSDGTSNDSSSES